MWANFFNCFCIIVNATKTGGKLLFAFLLWPLGNHIAKAVVYEYTHIVQGRYVQYHRVWRYHLLPFVNQPANTASLLPSERIANGLGYASCICYRACLSRFASWLLFFHYDSCFRHLSKERAIR